VKIIKIIDKHDPLLHNALVFSKHFRVLNALHNSVFLIKQTRQQLFLKEYR